MESFEKLVLGLLFQMFEIYNQNLRENNPQSSPFEFKIKLPPENIYPPSAPALLQKTNVV